MLAARAIRIGMLLPLLMGLAGGCRTIRPPRAGRGGERVLLVTGYCPCGSCCGWRRTWYGRAVYADGPLKGRRKKVGQTASGTRARPGTIAADGRLYPYGTVMHVPGYGYGRVEDRGSAILGDHIDVFFRRHEDALRWGSRRLRVTVWSDGRGEDPRR